MQRVLILWVVVCATLAPAAARSASLNWSGVVSDVVALAVFGT